MEKGSLFKKKALTNLAISNSKANVINNTDEYYVVNNEINKEIKANKSTTKEKELLDLIVICLHDEKDKNRTTIDNDIQDKDNFDNDRINFIKSINIFIEKNISNLNLLSNDIVLKKLFTLFEKVLFKYPKFLVFDFDKNSIEKPTVTLEEIQLVEESNSNLKIKSEYWTEMSNIYEIFILLLNTFSHSNMINKVNPIIKYLDKKFLSGILRNLNSSDLDQRLISKLILHKIYCSHVELRKCLIELFEEFMNDFHCYEFSHSYGLTDCLDLLKSIYIGLNKPINKRYLSIFSRSILPIFKQKNVKVIWVGFKNFMLSLLKYDHESFLPIIINFLYKSWPSKNPEKICLIIELIEIIYPLYKTMLIKLLPFKKIILKVVSSIKDMNVIIADKSLIIFKHDDFLYLFFDEFKLENKIIENLVENLKKHWSDDIKSISKLVLSKIKNNYPNIMNTISKELTDYIEMINISQENDDLWEVLKYDLKAD